MRNQFMFLGISTPKRKKLSRNFLKTLDKKSADWNFIFECWRQPERAFQYLAEDYLLKIKAVLTPPDIPKLRDLAVQKSWWDSQAPNRVFLEYLRSGRYIDGITLIKPETKHDGFRFDFYVEAGQRKIFIEVKGVTLEENGIVLFPDAPTERGVKHLNELAGCLREGYEAQVMFVV